MPIDPLAALNAMLRAEAARSTDAEDPSHTAVPDTESGGPASDEHRATSDDGAP
ncbi:MULTISPECIES: hypothetical protein [Streptomyces]|uniref:Uncharacterized protein n=1 Tax=Streptomyces maoxianensis TaxID=1459942 RepID=A0ABV9G2E4_9ACTN|nr:hypothetical protein [Streptomyces sp. ISL-1]MBT2393544.1 hypothetical protein [Streptomyces sp. ISL-1]